jgi:hypothetical protein
MKIVKGIFLSLFAIVALLLVIALFLPKDYNVQREVIIKKPNQVVFDYVKMLKNQKNYSVWVKKDPNAKMEFVGTDGTVGFESKWDSQDKEVGAGSQKIEAIEEGKKMDLDLHFIKPFEGKAKASLITEAQPDSSTKVKWTFKSTMPYPMNLMGLFMNMDKMLGKDLQDGLNNLRVELEK